MFRLVWFLLGLVIGRWMMQPLRTPTEVTPAPIAPAVVPPAASASQANDNLLDIKGIGPKFVEQLHAIGVTTFAQLAQAEPASLATQMGGRVTPERIRRERWIEQAKTLSGD